MTNFWSHVYVGWPDGGAVSHGVVFAYGHHRTGRHSDGLGLAKRSHGTGVRPPGAKGTKTSEDEQEEDEEEDRRPNDEFLIPRIRRLLAKCCGWSRSERDTAAVH